MVQTIQCFVDGKGGLHRNARDAHVADMTQWLQSTGSVNEAGASALAKGLVSDRDKLFELISMLESVARDTSTVKDTPATAAIMMAQRRKGE